MHFPLIVLLGCWFLVIGSLAEATPQNPSSDAPRYFSDWLSRAKKETKVRVLTKTRADLPLVVIGAGPAGLVVMAELKKRGIPFEAFEKFSELGGVWNQKNPLSPAYDLLITNSSISTTHLGRKFASTAPYISVAQAFNYLSDFARMEHLVPHIRFETEFLDMDKNSDGSWRVKFQRHDECFSQNYRGVIFATGFYNKSTKSYPEQIWNDAKANRIEVLHTSDFRSAEPFRGKKVLVVGMGNSGSEIATQLSQVGATTLLSVRSTPWIVPMNILGVPADEIAQGPPLPSALEVFLFHALQRIYVGHPVSLGLKSPKHGLLDRIPISDRGIARALREQKIHLRSSLVGVENGEVHYDESKEPSERVDAIIFATGYRHSSVLPKRYGDLEDPQFKLPFLLFHPSERGIAVMVDVSVLQGGWPMSWEQAKTLAVYFSAEAKDPGSFEGSRVGEFDYLRMGSDPDYKRGIFKDADRFSVHAQGYTHLLKSLRKWLLGRNSR